ncbi:MAG: hypothetical protein V7K89_06220 [Nostoc sp.]|uniref:hypothetical protein n=1 Tax=Nostoc sp. TaxID=1180 RepID=UPI002FF74119
MLRIYTLNIGQYSQSDRSPTFAPVLVMEISRFIQESKKVGQISATRAFRTWVKQQISIAGQ